MDCELFLESNVSSKSLAEIIQKIVAESVNLSRAKTQGRSLYSLGFSL